MSKPNKQKPGTSPEKKPSAKKVASQQLQALHYFFREGLAEMSDAEQQLLAAWPALAHAAQLSSLISICNECITVANIHNERLQKITELLTITGQQQVIKKCEAVTEIIATTRNFSPGTNADAVLTIACRKLLHYLIACYDGLSMLAATVQQHAMASLLAESRDTLQLLSAKLADIQDADNIKQLAA